MQQWQVQEAKARFSEFLDTTLKKGPQVVTRRGVEAALMVPSKNRNACRKPCGGTSRNCCCLAAPDTRMSP
jgi:prevent-host-death family protein